MNEMKSCGENSDNKKSDKKLQWAIYSFLAVIALAFFASAGISVYRYFSAVNDYTASVDGVVTGVKVKTHRSKRKGHTGMSYSYYPKYEFTVDDILYETTGKISYNKEFCTVGNPVAVLYDPDNPKRNCLKDDISEYRTGLFYVVVSAAAGVFVLIGGGRLIFGKPKKKSFAML